MSSLVGGTLGYLFLSLFVLKYSHWPNLLPIFTHSFSDILKAAQLSIYSMTGFEVYLMVYPFVKNPKQSHKFAQYGALFSNLLYLFSTLLAFTFFSEKQLLKTIWSQLSMTQVIQLPFIERLEYIAISAYALVIVTSSILPLWAATRGTHEIFRVKQRGVLIAFILITLIVSQLLTNRHDINNFISNASKVSFWLIYVYIPILFIIVWVKRKWKKSKEKKLILISCIALFSLTGCLQKNIIDDVQLIQGTVFDIAKDNKVKVTFVCPIQKKGNKVQVFEGTANAVKQVKADTSLESSQPFASGQMRVALFTTRIAKKGMSTSFDTLIRDVNIGNALYVALLEGNGTELLKGKYTTSSNVAIYIKKIVRP